MILVRYKARVDSARWMSNNVHSLQQQVH